MLPNPVQDYPSAARPLEAYGTSCRLFEQCIEHHGRQDNAVTSIVKDKPSNSYIKKCLQTCTVW